MTLTSISLAGSPDRQVDEALISDCWRHLDSAGYFYLRDVPDAFDHQAFVERFGTLTPQYRGELIWNLTPEDGMDEYYHSRNTRALVPHTECYEFPGEPPAYLALWCVRPAEGLGGATTLADGYEFLKELSRAELEQLETRVYTFRSSEGLRRQGVEMTAAHPILERSADRSPILRFSYNNTVAVPGDGLLHDFLERGYGFFARHHFSVTIERNGLLLWDNHRMIHSRTSFTDRRRHLRRALLSEHARSRSREHAPEGGRSGLGSVEAKSSNASPSRER